MVVDNKHNALKFRLIAALAENLAEKLEHNGTWPRDVQVVAQQISVLLSEVRE